MPQWGEGYHRSHADYLFGLLGRGERVARATPGVANVNNHLVGRDDCDDNKLGTLWIGNRDCAVEGEQ
jgi:hypothetical protein